VKFYSLILDHRIRYARYCKSFNTLLSEIFKSERKKLVVQTQKKIVYSQ